MVPTMVPGSDAATALGVLWRPDGSSRPASEVVAIAESTLGTDHPAAVSLRDPRLEEGASGFHAATSPSVQAPSTLAGAMLELTRRDLSSALRIARAAVHWSAPPSSGASLSQKPKCNERLSVGNVEEDRLSEVAGAGDDGPRGGEKQKQAQQPSLAAPAAASASASGKQSSLDFGDVVRRILKEADRLGQRSPTAERLSMAIARAEASKQKLREAEQELDAATKALVAEAIIAHDSAAKAGGDGAPGGLEQAARRMKRAKIALKRAAMSEAGWRAHVDATRATLEERRSALGQQRPLQH